MHVACPHCQNRIEVPDLSTVTEILCPACGSTFKLDPEPSTAAWSPKDGQRKLGKFDLLDAVGFGAFGTVFKAHDPELDRVVAIKVPRSGNLATGEDLSRFVREARSVARLRHPSIVPVYEVGQVDGLPYLVSEFVQGMTLADLLTARRMEPDKAATLLAEVADALQYAHDQGVIHRDVKPSNILLDSDGHPHLMDFGLAKRDAGEVTMTLDGQVLGTPAYISPEQAAGEAHKVDGRSDVYSLGVILYQLLTGELPFKGNARALLHQALHDEPPRPRQWAKNVPRDLETACLKAMAKEPARRYATAQALADDLRRFVKGEPILARPPSAVARSLRWLKRRRAVAAGVLAGVALSALVGGLVLYLRPGPRLAQLRMVPAEAGADSEIKTLPTKPATSNPAPLPADLELLPRDGNPFVTLRVADLVGQAGVKRLIEALAKYPELAAAAKTWETDFEKGLAVKPGELERLTLLAVPAPRSPMPDSLLILTTTQPYSRERLVNWLGPGPKEKSHRGKNYYTAAGPKSQVMYFLTDRIFLLSESESAVQRFLEREPSAGGRDDLRETLALADQRYQGAVGVELEAATAKALLTPLMQMFGPFFGAKQGVPLPPLISDVRSAVLLFDLRSGALSGDKLRLRLRLAYADADRAKRGAAEVRALFAAIQKPLHELMQQAVKTPKFFESRSTIRPEALQSMFGIFDQFELALQGAEIRPEGNVVDVRLLDLAVDVARMGTTLADLAQMSDVEPVAAALVPIQLALEDYVAANGHLPPPALLSADGKPLLSWRVALLPYLGQADLYKQFKLDEPWDGPHNKPLLGRMPAVYRLPEGTGGSATIFRVVVGPGTAFEGPHGIPLNDIKDGSANTVLVVAAAEAVPWTKPDELPYAPDRPLPRLGMAALFADGSVRYLFATAEESIRRAVLTRAGGEPVDLAKLPRTPQSRSDRLNQASWQIARRPGASADDYRWAVWLAEKACHLRPNVGNLLNTLGVAQYRAGRYADALATLTQSDRLNGKRSQGSRPADLAFLAMTHHRLGHAAEAAKCLRALRDRQKQPDHAKDAEGRAFLCEAEALIEGGKGARKK